MLAKNTATRFNECAESHDSAEPSSQVWSVIELLYWQTIIADNIYIQTV